MRADEYVVEELLKQKTLSRDLEQMLDAAEKRSARYEEIIKKLVNILEVVDTVPNRYIKCKNNYIFEQFEPDKFDKVTSWMEEFSNEEPSAEEVSEVA